MHYILSHHPKLAQTGYAAKGAIVRAPKIKNLPWGLRTPFVVIALATWSYIVPFAQGQTAPSLAPSQSQQQPTAADAKSLIDPHMLGLWKLLSPDNKVSALFELSTDPKVLAEVKDKLHLKSLAPNEIALLLYNQSQPDLGLAEVLDSSPGVKIIFGLAPPLRFSTENGGTMTIIQPTISGTISRADASDKENYEKQMEITTIRNNLRRLASAAQLYMLDKGVAQVSYQALVNGKYITALTPVAGEQYDNLVFTQAQTQISVEAQGIGVVTLQQ